MATYQWLECPCHRKAAFAIFRDPDYEVPPDSPRIDASRHFMHRDGTPVHMYERVVCETCNGVETVGRFAMRGEVFARKNIRRGDALPAAEGANGA